MAALLSLLFFVHLSAAAAAAGHRYDHHGYHCPHPKSATSVAPSCQIRRACKATRFPDACEAILSQSPSLPPNPSPSDLILAAANASASSLRTAPSMLQSILTASEKASNLNSTNTAHVCLDVLSYSDRRLFAAFYRALPAGALGDALAWASAALLYQYDCWSGFKYVSGTTQVPDAMAFLADLANLTSNAVAMLAALQRYGPDTALWGPPQTERDGYWADHVVSSYAAAGTTAHLLSDPSANFTVCKDGGCTYSMIQAAVDDAPERSASRFVIYIKAGVYEETVRVPYEKTNLEFVGDGMGKTVITGSLNVGMIGLTISSTATVGE